MLHFYSIKILDFKLQKLGVWHPIDLDAVEGPGTKNDGFFRCGYGALTGRRILLEGLRQNLAIQSHIPITTSRLGPENF
jgi:hypothetical protein